MRRNLSFLSHSMAIGTLVFASCSTFAATVTAGAGGSNIADVAETSASAEATAQANNGEGSSAAFINQNGVSAVFAQASSANGQTGNSNFARASWSGTIVNDTGFAQNYRLSFSLPDIRLELSGSGSDSSPDHMHARYLVEIRLNGNAIFHSNAELSGGRNDFVLSEGGTDLGGVQFGNPPNDFTFGFDFGSQTLRLLDLTSLSDGGSFLLETLIQTDVDYPGFEVGALARIGDPGNISFDPGLAFSVNAEQLAVPVPAGLPLLLTACGWLATTRLKRKSSGFAS